MLTLSNPEQQQPQQRIHTQKKLKEKWEIVNNNNNQKLANKTRTHKMSSGRRYCHNNNNDEHWSEIDTK